MDASKRFAENISKTEYENLPKEAVLSAKISILDTIGCSFAGARVADSEKLYRLLSNLYKGKCLAIGFRGNINPSAAVLLNTFTGRILDFDENDEDTGDHPSVAIVPVGLAISESEKNISGKEFITAIALGADIVLRIRRSCPLKLGRHPWTTGTYAPFAASATASKLLRFNEEQTWNALGIAFSECSNTVQSHYDGAHTHRLHHGMAAQAGYLSAIFAKEGFTGVRNILEGEFGFFKSFHSNQYNISILLENLGSHFEGVHLGVKSYPCCRLMHGAIDGVFKLTERIENFMVPDIKKITVKVNKSAYVLCGRQPWSAPKTVVESQFNIPYAVAVALSKGKVTIEEFTEKTIKDEEVLSLANKIEVLMDDNLNKIQRQIAPTKISIETKDGKVYECTIEYALGDPHNPISNDKINDKFLTNLRYANPNVNLKTATKIMQIIWDMENLDNMETIIKLLRKINVDND